MGLKFFPIPTLPFFADVPSLNNKIFIGTLRKVSKTTLSSSNALDVYITSSILITAQFACIV